MELMETQALIFYTDAKNTCSFMERKRNGEPTGGDGSLKIAAVNVSRGCNQHVAMIYHGVFFF